MATYKALSHQVLQFRQYSLQSSQLSHLPLRSAGYIESESITTDNMASMLSLLVSLGLPPSTRKGQGLEIVWPVSSQSTQGDSSSQDRSVNNSDFNLQLGHSLNVDHEKFPTLVFPVFYTSCSGSVLSLSLNFPKVFKPSSQAKVLSAK